MISYLRGPGGVRERLAAEFVPFCVALACGWVVAALFDVTVGVASGLVCWILVSLLLRAVRRHPLLRTVYRVALLAHIAFWTWQGIQFTHRSDPIHKLRSDSSAWSRELTFSAGAADVPFELPGSATLAGWGSRPRRIGLPPFAGFGPIGERVQAWMAEDAGEGPRRPLFHAPEPSVPQEAVGARAVVLRPQGEKRPVAIVRLDLVTSDAALTEAIQGGVADLGFRPESVIVAASHTHSGPGGYAGSRVSALLGTDHFDAAAFDAIRDAAIRAIREAHDSAAPAQVAVRGALDDGAARLARLRGRNAEAVERDDRVYAMHFVRADDRQPIATIVQYAVHPTLVRRRHMGFSRDLVGALEDALSDAWSGTPPVLFLNGALGDVAPEGRHGSGPEAAALLAGAFSEAVGPSLAWETSQLSTHLQMTLTRRAVFLDPACVIEGFGDRMRLAATLSRPYGTGDFADVVTDVLALPANMLLWSFGLTEMRFGFDWHRAVGVRVALADEPQLRSCGAWAFSYSRGAGKGAPARASLLWFQGEATTALGRHWRSEAGDDAPVFLVGLANGSLAYLTTPTEFAGGGYEAVATVHGPRAGRSIGEALRVALEEARRLRWR